MINGDWNEDLAEWWIAGAGIAIALAFLVLAIIAFVAYLKVRRQRDEALEERDGAIRELDEARAGLDEAQRELEGVRGERDEARRELEDARRHWYDMDRLLTPKLEEHAGKITELMKVLKRTHEDRQRLGELVAGYRKMADKGLGVLKRLVERQRSSGAKDAGEEQTLGSE